MNQFPREIANIFSRFAILYRSLSESVSVMSICIAILLQSSQAIRCLMLLCKISTQSKKPIAKSSEYTVFGWFSEIVEIFEKH